MTNEKELFLTILNNSGRIVKYVECDCGCFEHTLRFCWFDGPNEEEMYLHFFLQNGGFWKRLWLGVKYIFGFKSRYGHFGETILTHNEVEQLRNLCDKWLKKHHKPPVGPVEELRMAKLMVQLKKKAFEKAVEKQEILEQKLKK